MARYYNAESCQNRAISTEITGYTISAFMYLHSLTRDANYMVGARRAASFLTRSAWDPQLRIFPFESPGKPLAYFFDCGIIVRGLLSLWRVSRDPELIEIADACGRTMGTDFASDDCEFHPILSLPDKRPLPRGDQWSRLPGCYQLKSAMAWYDLYKATGATGYLNWYERALAGCFGASASFLPGSEGERVMDRLHAYCYFLEGALPFANQPEVAGVIGEGIGKVSQYLRALEPTFARSDVYAQLLRLRLLAERAGVALVDRLAAASEAEKLAGFQHDSIDQRVAGGFYFARRGAELQPHINPVSTAFGMQALMMWRQYLDGQLSFSTDTLI